MQIKGEHDQTNDRTRRFLLLPSFEAEVHPGRDRNSILINIRWKVNVLYTIKTVKFVRK